MMADATRLTIVGRSSSHFTRVTRIFAAEFGLEYSFTVVPSLLSTNPEDYCGNPALRLPSLITSRGTWFGALNACRELARRSKGQPRPVWPEDLAEPLLANAQELTLQAMSTEVSLIMGKLTGGGAAGRAESKSKLSLEGSLAWLEKNAKLLLNTPAPGRLSFLEVTLFCLLAHLEFRDVVSTDPYPTLMEFCEDFASRPSAMATIYRFDEALG